MITTFSYCMLALSIILPLFSYINAEKEKALRAKVRTDKLNALRRRFIALRTLTDEEIEEDYNVDFIFYNSYRR